MPELPEVERGRRIAQSHLVGLRVERVRTVNDRIVYCGVTPRRFATRLRGALVQAAHRRGKYIWLELDRPPHPVFHFGMTGSFHTYRDAEARPRFWKVELTMEDGICLAMPNPRRLGRIRLLQNPQLEPPLAKLGFDPLLDLPSLRVFRDKLEARKAPIKALLLDQSFAAGVGNWIADEVLYQARIDPRRRASDLDSDETARLRQKLRHVIHKAVSVDADKDRFPRSWLFHYRWRKNRNAQTHHGHRIRHITVGGRTTAFVPSIQR